MAAINCKPTVEGHAYDFTPMTKTGTDTDYQGVNTDPTDSYAYTMNVCAASTTSAAAGDCGANGGFFCQFDQQKTTLVATVGSITNPPDPQWNQLDDGVMLQATNGDKCFYQGQQIDRNLEVTFNCAPTPGTTFQIHEDPDQSKCLFIAKIDSAEACGGGGISTGTILIILCLSLFFVYCVAGFILMMKKHGKSGKEAIPNIDFWVAFPSNVKAGCSWTITMIKTKGKGGGETYDEL